MGEAFDKALGDRKDIRRFGNAYCPLDEALSRAVVVSTASAVGLAAIWKVTSTTPGARWWLAGGLGLGFALAGGLG